MTSTTHAFDTLIYARKLKKAGFTEKQADAQAEALASVVNENLATKQDIKKLGQEFRHEMKHSETKVIFRLSSILVVLTSFLSGMIVIFSH